MLRERQPVLLPTKIQLKKRILELEFLKSNKCLQTDLFA